MSIGLVCDDDMNLELYENHLTKPNNEVDLVEYMAERETVAASSSKT